MLPFLLTLYFVSIVKVYSLSPISVKGRYFFTDNDERFYIKGIAYQQDPSTSKSKTGYNDPLANVEGCKRDIPYLKQLGVNVIRTYAIDPTANHDECFQMLSDAGIYVISDLSQPNESINRAEPSWTTTLFDRYTSTIDALSKYDNVMAFIAANEVVDAVNVTQAAPFVKAAIRDIKAYIKEKNYRAIPVGYSADDAQATRDNVANYLGCGDPKDRGDFYAINIYEWCGDSNFKESGYEDRTNEFKDFDAPLFFSEFGCIDVRPRKFTEVEALFSKQMTDVWSGGIVYMYFEENNHFGVVSMDGSDIKTLTDFPYLASQYSKVSPTKLNKDSYTPSSGASVDCPTVGSNWQAATPLPNTPSDVVCDCMYDSLDCVVSSSVSEKDYGDLFGVVCGLSNEACAGIMKDAKNGKYGSYQMCNDKYQLSWVLNRYYHLNNKAASACSFSGSASLKSAQTGQNCASYLSQAQSAGTGTITNAPLGTIGAKQSSGSDDNSGKSSDGNSKTKSNGYKSIVSGPAIIFVALMTMGLTQVLMFFI